MASSILHNNELIISIFNQLVNVTQRLSTLESNQSSSPVVHQAVQAVQAVQLPDFDQIFDKRIGEFKKAIESVLLFKMETRINEVKKDLELSIKNSITELKKEIMSLQAIVSELANPPVGDQSNHNQSNQINQSNQSNQTNQSNQSNPPIDPLVAAAFPESNDDFDISMKKISTTKSTRKAKNVA